MAYVGKAYNGDVWQPARIQTAQPGRGAYMEKSKKSFFVKSGGFFLADNPNYHYYWAEASEAISYSNAVSISLSGSGGFVVSIGRLQIDGQTRIGLYHETPGLLFVGSDGIARNALHAQILLCDPKPANPCGKL